MNGSWKEVGGWGGGGGELPVMSYIYREAPPESGTFFRHQRNFVSVHKIAKKKNLVNIQPS